MRKKSTSPDQPTDGLTRLVWRLFAALSAAVVVIGVLLAVIIAERASDQSKAACQAYNYIAEAPLSPNTTDFGLHISAGFRIAYYKARCDEGPLEPADKRLYPYLPEAYR